MQQISSHWPAIVTRITAPNPGPMTAQGTNSYIVGSRQSSVAVIDPGPASKPHLHNLLKTIGEREVCAILTTHAHLDHTSGAPALAQATKAPLIAYGPQGSGRSKIMARLAQTADIGGGEGADLGYTPDIVLKDQQDIVCPHNGWKLRALHTPGHTGDHMCFSLEGAGVLFSGDHVMGWASSLVSPPDGDMAAFMRSLAQLSKRDDHLYLPGHGDEITEPQARVRHLTQHRLMRAGQIQSALKGGAKSAQELAAELYPDVPAALQSAAARNVLAHLIELTEHGAAAPLGEIKADAQFKLLA